MAVPAGRRPVKSTVEPYLLIAPFFLVFALVGVFPLLYSGFVSLYDWDLLDGPTRFVGLGNYAALLSDAQFGRALANTLSILAMTTVPQVVIAVLLAALLDTRLRAPTAWRVGVLLPCAMGVAAVGVVFANLFGPTFGFVNAVLQHLGLTPVDWQSNRFASHLAIATMVNWRWTGYNALIVLAALQAIPRELHEAATVDGAGPVRRFTAITLPLLRPTLVFVVVTSTIGGLQLFTEPKLLDPLPGTNGGATHQFQTANLYLYQSAFDNQSLGYASAIACTLTLLVALVAVANHVLTRHLAGPTR
ncbi:sugar ABC transporter permease [Actinokineospora auranticolor]|nr:sugar ABC transporter permease [Actinokineospora auranticolor]